MVSSVSNFDSIVYRRVFAILVNGPLALGLAIMEEKGLAEDDKLAVFGPELLLKADYPFSILSNSGTTRTVIAEKCNSAILLSARNVAIKY